MTIKLQRSDAVFLQTKGVLVLPGLGFWFTHLDNENPIIYLELAIWIVLMYHTIGFAPVAVRRTQDVATTLGTFTSLVLPPSNGVLAVLKRQMIHKKMVKRAKKGME